MIKPSYSFLFSFIFLVMPLCASVEANSIAKKKLEETLSLNNETAFQTLCNLCTGKITIEPHFIFDCAGISISTESEYEDFLDILNSLSKEQIFDFFARTNQEGNSLLHLLVLNEKTEFIKALLTYPINIDSINKDGNTPLHLAAKKQNLKIIELLIQHGASITIKNNKNKIPENYLPRECENFIQINYLRTHGTAASKASIYDTWIRDVLDYSLGLTKKFGAHINKLKDKHFIDMYYADENQAEDTNDEFEDDIDEAINGL